MSRVSEQSFQDAVLVLAGHGTSLDPDSAASMRMHAEELRRRKLFSQVVEGFWKQEPLLAQVFSSLTERRVFIVPFFLSEGYFPKRIIPASLGFTFEPGKPSSRVMVKGEQTLFYCEPVGTHPRVLEILIDRVTETLKAFPFPRAPEPEAVAVLVAAHGTERDENSKQAPERHVTSLRERKLFAEVQAAYLDEEPRIRNVQTLLSGNAVVVVPFFAGEGPHVKKDIPVLLGAPERMVEERLAQGQWPWRNPTEIGGKLVWYARPVGSHSQMAEIILDRAREAAAWA
jgi:sirohydrochlorin cobaltochelatase